MVEVTTENSLVGVGDETGFVRLIETERDLSPGFNATYLGIPCHENAVFDISWAPDDHQMVGVESLYVLVVSVGLIHHLLSYRLLRPVIRQHGCLML